MKHKVQLSKIHDRLQADIVDVLDMHEGHLTDGEIIAILGRTIGVIIFAHDLNANVTMKMVVDNMVEGLRFAEAVHNAKNGNDT